MLDLVPQSNVKVNDVAVGKVVAVVADRLDRQGQGGVNGDVELPANAQAAVKQTSLLGEKFVELSQPLNAAEGALKNGDTIPLTAHRHRTRGRGGAGRTVPAAQRRWAAADPDDHAAS